MPQQDSNYSDRVRTSFARQGLMNHIGAHLVRVGQGEAEIELEYKKEITQQHGHVHAGALAAIADSVRICRLLVGPGGHGGPDGGIQHELPRACERSPAGGESKVVRRGRTLTVCAADVYSINKKSEQLVALMTATIFTKSP